MGQPASLCQCIPVAPTGLGAGSRGLLRQVLYMSEAWEDFLAVVHKLGDTNSYRVMALRE